MTRSNRRTQSSAVLHGEPYMVLLADGIQKHYKDHLLHRDDGPAIILPDGTEKWYQHGKLHRVGGPASILPKGRTGWYCRGQLHRVGGPAMVDRLGMRKWYRRGKRHRTDGPAAIYANGRQAWYLNDKLHRADGPAIINPDGTEEWYVHGYPLVIAAAARALAEELAGGIWEEELPNLVRIKADELRFILIELTQDPLPPQPDTLNVRVDNHYFWHQLADPTLTDRVKRELLTIGIRA